MDRDLFDMCAGVEGYKQQIGDGGAVGINVDPGALVGDEPGEVAGIDRVVVSDVIHPHRPKNLARGTFDLLDCAKVGRGREAMHAPMLARRGDNSYGATELSAVARRR